MQFHLLSYVRPLLQIWTNFTLLAYGYTRMTDLKAFLHQCYKHGLWNPVIRKGVLSML